MSRLRPYIAFVVVAAVLLVLFPSKGQFMYKYQKGSPWTYATPHLPYLPQYLSSRKPVLASVIHRDLCCPQLSEYP